MRGRTGVILGVILLLVVVLATFRSPALRRVEGYAEQRVREVGGNAAPALMDRVDAAPVPSAPAEIVTGGFTSLPMRLPGDAMIIRTGTASLEIDTLERGIAGVRDLAVRAGGYVANSDIQAVQGGYRSATLEVRVPSDRFDALVSGLSPLGKVERVNVSAQDVGEEFTDVSARVANGRKLEARLIELIATRTGKLADVLEIERELARVREEIERLEGRLRYLQAHASVSSLSITVHEPGPIVGQRGSLAVLGEAFAQAWRNGISFTAAGIAALGTLVPLTLLVLAGALGLRRAWRSRVA
ncbi:MAG: DUF4349 domain-containing protein [Gemmatimonadales bacterium]